MRWWLVALVLAIACADASAQPVAGDRARAASHFKQGQIFYKQGAWDRALAEYQAAFDLSHEPLLIFNVGLCHDRANRPEQALEAFQRYLELEPNGKAADEARDDVARLVAVVDKIRTDRAVDEARKADEARARERASADEQARREAAAIADARARRERDELDRDTARSLARKQRIALYVAGGGAALLATGLLYDVLAVQPARTRLANATTTSEYDRFSGDFFSSRNVAIGLYTAGALTVATALVLRFAVFKRRDVVVTTSLVPHGGALVVQLAR
jgi:tetratricopeptide (TPR) repeat protein